MSRDIDPRFSTALREELTRRADAVDADADADADRTLPARRQWIVVAVTAAVLFVVIGALLTTVHRPAPPANGPIPSSGPSTLVEGLADPLTEVKDAEVGSSPFVLLHVAGTGPSTYTITVPSPATQVSAYLSCTPGSTFRMDVGGKAFWSQCSGQTNTARIPVEVGERQVRISVDSGTRFIALVLPWAEGTSFSMLTVTPTPVDYPTGSLGTGPELARARGTGEGTSGRFSRVPGVVEVDVVCRGIGSVVVRVGAGSLGLPEEQSNCRSGETARMSVPTGPAFTVDGSRADWQVTPYGNVSWAVVFRAP